jgi:hypothetical protein
MAGDYGPTIEEDEPYEKLREAGRAERQIDSIFDLEMIRRPGGRVG